MANRDTTCAGQAAKTDVTGKWAFGEGLEVCYLVVLFYLLWPIFFNTVGHLPKLWASFKKA